MTAGRGRSVVPGRVSALPSLARCPGFAALAQERASSKAADTGTATGFLVERFHAGDMFLDAAARMYAESERYGLADLDQARDWGRMYAEDPRNQNVVEPGSCELEVTLTLQPAPEDQTRLPIRLVGHVDQLRRINGQLSVWDVKCGRPSGLEMVYSYAWQLAAYSLASTETLGEAVLPGGIIRMRGYSARGVTDPTQAKVFFRAPWTLDQCRDMMESVAWHIANLRAGTVALHPGTHCQWCPAGGPHLCSEKIGAIYDETS